MMARSLNVGPQPTMAVWTVLQPSALNCGFISASPPMRRRSSDTAAAYLPVRFGRPAVFLDRFVPGAADLRSVPLD